MTSSKRNVRVMKFKMHHLTGILTVLLLLPCCPAFADDSTETNPQPYRCEDSVVTKLVNYFAGQPDSGYVVLFKTRLGVEQFPDTTARVVDRSAGAKSAIARQQVGDKVQVCLVSSPSKDQFCNPDKDYRSRVYRIYNYRLRTAFSGWNANHGCGGA